MCALTHLPLKHSKSPMRIHVPSHACDVISFYGQRQLCHLTVQGEEIFQTKPEWAHFSQEGPEKKAKKVIDIDPKTPMMQMHDKVRKVKEEGSLRESEKKSQVCCVSFKLQTLKSCLILRMPTLQILHPVQTITKCTRNIQFQNSFLVRLSFFWPNSDQKTTQLASKQVFWQNSLKRVG